MTEKISKIIIKLFTINDKLDFKIEGRKPKQLYLYKNSAGENSFYVARYEYEEYGKRKKDIRPWFYVKEGKYLKWKCKWMLEENRPLYNLENLQKYTDKKVIVVEGEKNVNDGQALLPQYIFITSSGGAKSPKLSDWSSLNDRDIIIWPDKDEAGIKYKNEVVKFANGFGARSVNYLKIPDYLPQGFDISDAIEMGWSKSKIQDFITNNIKKSKGLPTLTIEELYDYQLPERIFYYPWFREGSLNMVFAQRGLGKTFFSLGFASSLVQGKKFLNWECEKEVGGLYIDGEMTLHDIRERLQMFISRDSEQMGLEILSHEELYYTEEEDLELTNKDIMARIKDFLLSNKHVKFIVLDNLSCLFPSLEEDKRGDWMESVHPFLLWCRNNSIAALMVHHANKKGEQRGSSAREDALDIVIELSPVPETDDEEGACFYVDFLKHRAITKDIIPALEVRLKKNGNWDWKEKEKASEDLLYQLALEGVETVKDAAEIMKISEGYVSKLKTKLVKKGVLRNLRRLEVV